MLEQYLLCTLLGIRPLARERTAQHRLRQQLQSRAARTGAGSRHGSGGKNGLRMGPGEGRGLGPEARYGERLPASFGVAAPAAARVPPDGQPPVARTRGEEAA